MSKIDYKKLLGKPCPVPQNHSEFSETEHVQFMFNDIGYIISIIPTYGSDSFQVTVTNDEDGDKKAFLDFILPSDIAIFLDDVVLSMLKHNKPFQPKPIEAFRIVAVCQHEPSSTLIWGRKVCKHCGEYLDE